MSILVYTETEIIAMLSESKISEGLYADLITLKQKRSHKEGQADLEGVSGLKYRLILRQNSLDQFDFSAILGVFPENSGTLFRLRRYNGRHGHRNAIEKHNFIDFHMHEATERYQLRGTEEDCFATVTSRYSTLIDALQCLISDCNIRFPDITSQETLPLFNND